MGTSPADTSVWRLNYEFGQLNADGISVDASKNDGNIAKQITTSGAGAFVQTHRYDSLDRLKQAQETVGGTQTWIQNFAY